MASMNFSTQSAITSRSVHFKKEIIDNYKNEISVALNSHTISYFKNKTY